MTALWIAIIMLGLAVLMSVVANGLLWLYTAGLTTVLRSHVRDGDAHWSTKWEEDSNA